METDNGITITHFINPHLFWYKPIGIPGESKLHVLNTFEQILLELYKNKPSCDNLLRPQIGDKVAVHFIAWNKYIRAKILQKAEYQQEEYIVWAIDYGFPLLTKKEYIRSLPTHLQTDIDYVRLGGIVNVSPAEQEYDEMQGNLVMVKKDKWYQKTCNMLEMLLADANSVSFIEHYKTGNDHTWGDLAIINHKDVEINARNYLLNTTNAVEEDDETFKDNCAHFKSTRIAPWLSNDRNSKIKINNIKHNYIEHSNKINAAIIDENAKRKVADWQERNERKKNDMSADVLEIGCELPLDHIDDITFDDSASVSHNQHINYIAKAGILTKVKQQKYSTDKDLPPFAFPKSFEIVDIMLDPNLPKEQQHVFSRPGCSEDPFGLENKSQNGLKEEKISPSSGLLYTRNKDSPLVDLESNSSSKVSSVKMRQKILYETRLKLARAQREIKNKSMCNQNATNDLTISHADSYPYQLLEQSSILSTPNSTVVDNTKENKSLLSAKNIRVKELMAMRRKLESSSFPASSDINKINNTMDSQCLSTNNPSKTEREQQHDMDKNMKALNDLNFQLTPKMVSKSDDKTKQVVPQMYSTISASKNVTMECVKSGYDSITMVPAGFDITRLQTYRDEKNHWHRKKSTRNDYVPHDKTSSTDELLSNSTNDQSFSSSIDQFNRINSFINKTNNPHIVKDSQQKLRSQEQDSPFKGFEVNNLGGNKFSNDLSTYTGNTGERTWDSKTTKQVRNWIMDDMKSNYVIQASIDFSLANSIWVKNVVVIEKLTGIDAYCQVVNLKKSLVKKNFGVLYNGDRKHVRDLAEEFGLLNSLQFDNVNTGDSDIDYQSCKNESINLIRFSSSNDETATGSMGSAETSLEKIETIENKTTDIDVTRKRTDSANAEIEVSTTHEEENWDDNFPEVYDPFQIFNSHNDKLSKEEKWLKLPLNELVKVEIGDEGENGNWENIFLQIIDNKSMYVFDELNKLIVKHVENLKLNTEKQKEIYDFNPLHNCIVKYDNRYLRAKVYAVYGENLQQRLYRFFLCDYACFTNSKTEDLYNDFLYETTDEIVTFTPYQAIHCTLAGIKWDRFCKRYQVTKKYLYACPVLECDYDQNSISNLHNLPIQSYNILLYECEIENDFNNALLFNTALVDNGITVYDEETKNFLEYEIGFQQKDNKKSSNTVNNDVENKVDNPNTNKCDVVTYEQLIDLIKSNAFDVDLDDILSDVKKTEVKTINNNAIDYESKKTVMESEKIFDKTMFSDMEVLKENAKIPTCDSEMEEQGHCTSSSNSIAESSISLISTDDPESQLLAPLPSLKVLHKRPLTTWYQNDFMIFLSIYAPDVQEYHLEVALKTVLFKAEIQREKFVLMLKLLGSIDTERVSHEIRGRNIVIRLKKNVFMEWPRLLEQTTKYSWLKYNFNAFDSVEMEYIMPQQILHTILDNELHYQGQQIDNYNSDEDNERELYQTYNPIQTNDDDCDPFSAF